MNNHIDLASFFAQDDASIIIEAFASIKPGPVRQSLIAQIKAVAALQAPQKAVEAPSVVEATEPAKISEPAPRPARQYSRNDPRKTAAKKYDQTFRKTVSPEIRSEIRVKAVELRKQGIGPSEAAATLSERYGITIRPSVVSSAVYDEKRKGIVFPEVNAQ